jgi:hypothetical protein
MIEIVRGSNSLRDREVEGVWNSGSKSAADALS